METSVGSRNTQVGASRTSRKTIGRAAVASLLLLEGLVPALAAAGGAQSGDTQRVLVRFSNGISNPKAAEIVAKNGGKLQSTIPGINVQEVKVPPSDVTGFLKSLRSRADVVYAQPEATATIDAVTPNDPKFSNQWSMRQTRATRGWSRTTGSSSVTVAIIDTGVDLTHPDLGNKLVAGYDYVDNDTTANDVNGHGTSVAGIVAAGTDNKRGIASYCWHCKIMPLKVAGGDGIIELSLVARGLVHAADNGVRVVNMSLSTTVPFEPLHDAIKYAHDRGVIMIGSAGNIGTTQKRYPAAYPQVIAVAATQKDGSRRSTSTYGSWVGVAAPGTNQAPAKGGGYKAFGGTSSAAPVVAGLAGLSFSLAPSAPKRKIRRAILRGSVGVSWVANGRVNVRRTLTKIARSTS